MNMNDFEALLAQNANTQKEALKLLSSQGQEIDLGEWVTIKEYAKRFGIKSTNVVSNWINRGVIPPENIIDIAELNNIRLIRAVPYKAKTSVVTA